MNIINRRSLIIRSLVAAIVLATLLISSSSRTTTVRADEPIKLPTTEELKLIQPQVGKTYDHRPTQAEMGFTPPISETNSLTPTASLAVASVQSVSAPVLEISIEEIGQTKYLEGYYRISGLNPKQLPIQVYIQATKKSSPEFWCALMQDRDVISFTSSDEYLFDDQEGKVFSYNGSALSNEPVSVVCSFQADVVLENYPLWKFQTDVYANYQYVDHTTYSIGRYTLYDPIARK